MQPPQPRKLLTQVVRDFWCSYKGDWTDGQEVRALRSVDGHVIGDDACESFRDSFVPLCGDACRLLLVELLDGPPLWLSMLSERR